MDAYLSPPTIDEEKEMGAIEEQVEDQSASVAKLALKPSRV